MYYAGHQGKWLDMGARLDVAIDVAHAITYLHMYAGICLYLSYPYLTFGNPLPILYVACFLLYFIVQAQNKVRIDSAFKLNSVCKIIFCD